MITSIFFDLKRHVAGLFICLKSWQILNDQKIRLIAFIVILFLSNLAFSQNIIRGKVVDKNNKSPLEGATISVLKTNTVVVANEQGEFKISNIQKGNFVLKVSFLGYKTEKINVSTETTSELIIELEVNEIMNEEVIISANRANDKTPATFKNISSVELQKINTGRDIPFLLNATPSAVVTSDAGTGVGYTGIRIRGSDLTRINVTINGVPLNDPESQMVYFVDLPDFASSVSNIQIQRGVGTSTNGPASFGASIHIQTQKLNSMPYAEINSHYGSFNTFKNSLLFGTGLIGGRWAFDGRLSKITSDGYIDRATSDLKSLYLSGGYYGEKNILKFNVFSGKEITYQSWYGVPEDSLKPHRTYNPYTYENQIDNYQQDHYQLVWSSEISKSWAINAALHYTKGKGYYEEYEDTNALYSDTKFADYGLKDVVIGTDTIKKSNFIRQRWLDNDFYGITFSANYYHPKKKFQAVFGGAWNKYEGDHFGKVIWASYASNGFPTSDYYDNTGIKKDFNIFLKLLYAPFKQIKLTDPENTTFKGRVKLVASNINLFVDMQYRQVDYSFLGLDENLNNLQQSAALDFFNPKAGISYNGKNSIVYASYSVGNKEPNRDDYVISKPSARPKPENLQNVEAGYKYIAKKISFSINWFYMNYTNQLVLTGKINESSEYIRVNIPKSRRQGLEADLKIGLTKNLILMADGAYSLNKINAFTEYIDNWDDGGQMAIEHQNTDISFSPPLIASLSLSYAPFKGFNAVIFTKYISSQYLDNSSDKSRMLKAYNATDLRFYYSIETNFVKEILFSFSINNIFNQLYESNGWTYRYFYGGKYYNDNHYFPQAGINFMGGVGFKFR